MLFQHVSPIVRHLTTIASDQKAARASIFRTVRFLLQNAWFTSLSLPFFPTLSFVNHYLEFFFLHFLNQAKEHSGVYLATNACADIWYRSNHPIWHPTAILPNCPIHFFSHPCTFPLFIISLHTLAPVVYQLQSTRTEFVYTLFQFTITAFALISLIESKEPLNCWKTTGIFRKPFWDNWV